MTRTDLVAHREFLKDTLRLRIDFAQTEQSRGVAAPPLEKPPRPEQTVFPLPGRESFHLFAGIDLTTAIAERRSHRRFRAAALSLTELAFLLWATQGVREVLAPGCALRTVPSAGCRHAFESYLLVTRVDGLAGGLYRYLPIEHALVLERTEERIGASLVAATLHQDFVASAPVTFAWTALPARMEWRYDLAAHRVMLMDVGHLCQNLYLACIAIGAGTCAIAAYHQELMDRLLGVDGSNEFTVYLAPVGKI
jgi:SagB-type dehydrogenase family enzyme